MMKIFLMTTALVAAMGSTALASDLPSKKAPPAAPLAAAAAPFSWTGCYLGPHFGGSFGHTTADNDGDIINMSTSGFTYGGSLGCNYQMNQFVVGAEANLWGSTLKGSHFSGGEGLTTRSRWGGDLGLRAGYAFDTTLVYGKAGVATTRYSHIYDNGDGTYDKAKSSHTGLLLGLGVEHAIDTHWSIKLEYNFISYGKKDADFYYYDSGLRKPGLIRAVSIGGSAPSYDYTASLKNTQNVIKVGVNYRF